MDAQITALGLTVSDLEASIANSVVQGESQWTVDVSGALIFENLQANASMKFSSALESQEFHILT